MQLYYSTTSPFARKVQILMMETGLMEQTELVIADGWDPQAPLNRLNPLSQIPTLILDDGETLYDSGVICDYLDSLHDGEPFVPLQQPLRGRVLRTQALADGLMTASVAIVVEHKRAESKQSSDWIAFQQAAIGRGLDALNSDIDQLKLFDLGAIAVACAIGHLDFRNTFGEWRPHRGALSDWYAEIALRPSVRETLPFAS